MFSKLIKKIDLDNYIELSIEINQIKAQYNPDRFRFWKSLHKGPEKEVFNMVYSPHYRFLMGEKNAYYKMHQLYGKNNKWIKEKVNKFKGMFDSIQNEGVYNNIYILRKPLVKNKYNNSFEIFEGHHRLACCLVLGMKKIICRIVTIR